MRSFACFSYEIYKKRRIFLKRYSLLKNLPRPVPATDQKTKDTPPAREAEKKTSHALDDFYKRHEERKKRIRE